MKKMLVIFCSILLVISMVFAKDQPKVKKNVDKLFKIDGQEYSNAYTSNMIIGHEQEVKSITPYSESIQTSINMKGNPTLVISSASRKFHDQSRSHRTAASFQSNRALPFY